MLLAVKIILGVVALVWIIWPYISSKTSDESKGVSHEALYHLMEEKEHTYAAIKELDFDYNMGKLSDGDYKELKHQYKEKAVAVLRQIDELTGAVETKGKVSG